MKAKVLGAIATAALLTSFSSAKAAIVEVTYTGTVASSTDPNGVFGPAGDNMINGANYQVTYTFNTSLGNYSSNPLPPPLPTTAAHMAGRNIPCPRSPRRHSAPR